MRCSLQCAVAVVTVCMCATASAHVLGVEAAGPLKRWTGALKGVSVEAIGIHKSRVEITLKGGCVLGLNHPESPGCAVPQTVGNAVACWSGSGCPSDSGRVSATDAAGALSLPWRNPTDGTEVRADTARETALVRARKETRFAFWRNDIAQARALMAPVVQRADLRPEEWMSLLPLASRAGLGAEAWRVTENPAPMALTVEQLVALRVTLLMGPDLGASVARILLTGENACLMEHLASAFVDVRAYAATIRLAEAVRRVDPDCFEAYSDESEAATMLQDLERQRSVVEQALERFKGDPRLGPMEEVYLLDQGKGHLVQERLEKRLAAGDRSPGLLKELLTFYIQVEGRPQRMKRFMSRTDADPQDTVASFFAGVLLHYERQFERSQSYLKRLKDVFPNEARLHIYLAMNAFNLGQRAEAETHIDRAAALDTRDPDVPYCIAEIYRDTDRRRALGALKSYWSQTTYTSNPTSEKQRRVWAMITALERCVDAETTPPCPGPWEHYFDQVSLDAEAKRHADIVADLRDKGLIGGGTNGAPEDLMVPPGVTAPPEGWEPGMPLPTDGKPPEGWPPGWRPGMEPPAGFKMPRDFRLPPGVKMPAGYELLPSGERPEGFETSGEDGKEREFVLPKNMRFPPGFDPARHLPAGAALPPGMKPPPGWKAGMPNPAAPTAGPRPPAGMPRGVPFEEANVPGTMPPGYEPPPGWKPGDPMVPGLTPPDVEKRRREEGSQSPAQRAVPEEATDPESDRADP